jgi:hypothetical protein
MYKLKLRTAAGPTAEAPVEQARVEEATADEAAPAGEGREE